MGCLKVHEGDFIGAGSGGRFRFGFAQDTKKHPEEFGFVKAALKRAYYAFGPLGAGFVLDFLDLATFGPIGLFLGLFVGAAAGWVIADLEGLQGGGRIALAFCAAIYMFLPLTEPLPVATCFGLVARFFRGPLGRTESDSNEFKESSDDP